MGVDFNFRDFAHPFSMAKAKRAFDRNQTLPAEALADEQWRRFVQMASHGYQNVPYYRRLFDERGVSPAHLVSREDMAALPCLTKSILSRSFAELRAVNAQQYKCAELRTSGTTGGQVRFLVDKSSNLLEFNYYWRFWGWHGYRLGDRFAEFSAESFVPLEQHRRCLFKRSRFTNRTLVNSLLLSRATAREYVALFKALRPKFLKGLPSNLHAFALLCRDLGESKVAFRAIFSQGEQLSPRQRSLIEEVFSSPVYDSYGHLERTVAISQCPRGKYHVHSDYGFTEFLEPIHEPCLPFELSPSQSALEIVSSSLHNLAMPLLRYRTGDLAIIDANQSGCPCGRAFPVVHAIIGRETDIVITPDKRAITALYVALDRVAGLACAQIVQESLDTLVVRIVPAVAEPRDFAPEIVRAIHSFTGTSMQVTVRECTMEEIRGSARGKFKSLVSHVDVSTLTS